MQRVFAFSMVFTGDREEAKDIAQEALIKAFLHIGTFRGQGSLASWLFRVAHNVFLDRKRADRSRGYHLSVPLENAESIVDERQNAEASVVQSGTRKLVLEAVAGLEPAYRMAVLLVDMEGLSYKEAAEVMAVPVGTVKSRVNRAHDALSNSLRKKLPRKEGEA